MAALQQVKIYRYLDIVDLYYDITALEHAPVGLNYKTHLNRSLIPDRTFVQGELRQVNWYADYNPTTEVYSDLILRVDVTYTRDAAGFALYRDTTRTWIREDDTDAAPVKTTRKYYNGKDRDLEGIRRRGNIVSQVKTIISAHLMFGAVDPTDFAQTQAQLDIGRTFYEAREVEAKPFVELSRQDIFSNIAATPATGQDAWLDEVLRIGHDGSDPIEHPLNVTCRQAILAELNIWGL